MEGLIGLVLGIGFYVFYCYCLKLICEKCGKNPGVLIWIPILQIIPMLEVAGLPVWYIVLLLIPLVNIVVMVYMYWKICERRGKPGYVSLMIFVPFLNIVFLPYLAFSE